MEKQKLARHFAERNSCRAEEWRVVEQKNGGAESGRAEVWRGDGGIGGAEGSSHLAEGWRSTTLAEQKGGGAEQNSRRAEEWPSRRVAEQNSRRAEEWRSRRVDQNSCRA